MSQPVISVFLRYVLLKSRDKTIKNIAIFKSLSKADLLPIEQCCTYRSYEKGKEIISHLDNDNKVYFVLTGAARVEIYSAKGKIVGFRKLAAGDVFGEYSAIDDAPRSASVVAQRQCRIAFIQSADFMHLLSEYPTISKALMLHFVTQLRSMTSRIFEYSTLFANDRIEVELLRLAREEGHPVSGSPNTVRIDKLPTHLELARRVSSYREAVSRHLSHLSDTGVTKKEGRALLILDVVQFSKMVREATGE